MPEFIYTVRDSLSNLSGLSKQDSVFLLYLTLFTSSDKELKSYLTSNLKKFQDLTLLFAANEKDKADMALAAVGCNAIYKDNQYPGCTFIQIQKFNDMETGFIQASDSSLVPLVSFEEFVYIEEVVKGWLIYRTM